MCVYVCVCVWVIVKFSYYYAKNLMRLNFNMNELRNPFIHIYTVAYVNTRIYILIVHICNRIQRCSEESA